MIEVKNLRAGYGKTEVLHDVSLTARPGEITAVIGPNGCGKSTLLKTIAGILPLSQGQIQVCGASADHLSAPERARQTAYLPQSKNTPDITAGRMVLHGRFPYLSYPRKYRKSDYEAAEAAMEKMDILALADTPLAQLSGGTRQKVYIAMALAQRSPVILMDEPTSYLDISQQQKTITTLRELAEEGKTVVLVLHDLLYALKFSTKICVMNEGRLLMQNSPGKIMESGILKRIYGIEVKSLASSRGEQYYYEM